MPYTTTHSRSTKRSCRRGIASVLAMLFLVLFAVLALGFYSSVTTSVQIAGNEQRSNKARLAAESGVQFMRYQLAHVNIPNDSTTVLSDLYTDLKTSLEGTANLGSHTVSLVDNTIYIPGETASYIPLDTSDGTGFSATITEWNGGIVCKVSGISGATSTTDSKSVSLEFDRVSIPSDAFDYAIASKGSISMQKGTLSGVSGVSTNDIATVMSAKGSGVTINVSGGTIGGDLNVVSGGNASVTGGSVGGTSNIAQIMDDHVHTVSTPSFPTFDTTVFKQYATNTYSSGSTLTNVVIPAGTNPKFTGGATIQGILYIESPNTVQFRGNVNLNGFIVFEGTNDSSQNVIDMRGNFTWGPLPSDPQFDSLRSTTGIAILAPTTSMTMSGSADSTVRGNVILGSFDNAGSANVTIDQGTLMTLDNGSTASATFNSSKTVKFKATGKFNQPSQGVIYDTKYTPVAGSFQELD